MEQELGELLDLENAGWRSLCHGTGGDFYRTIMTNDSRMILADGSVMSRSDVVASLDDAPPWSSYEITDPLLLTIDDNARALIYTGTGRRTEGADFVGVMTSLYVRDPTGWKLALYQQTPMHGDT